MFRYIVMTKNTKPYFGKDVEDRIVSVVNFELSQANKTIDEAALRAYIQAGKHTYENAVLAGVANGEYLATVQEGNLAYKVNTPSERDVDEFTELAKTADERALKAGKPAPGVPTSGQIEIVIKNQRAAKLSHALNQVAMRGSKAKLGVEAVEAVEVAAVSVEGSASTPIESSTAEEQA